MNKKDTIIIAVLINSGLLALLFMMAINTDEEVINDESTMAPMIAENQPPQQEPLSFPQGNGSELSLLPSQILANTSPVDEMDSFLSDFSARGLSQSGFIDEEGNGDLDHEAVHAFNQEKFVDAKSNEEAHTVMVTVKRGDALEKIARSNGTTVAMIKKINNLSSSKLVIGQVLRVPLSTGSSSEKASPSQNSSNHVANRSTKANAAKEKEAASPVYYTIKSGDNPWKIAKQHHVKYDDILKLNGIDEAKARNLKIGDKIRVK